MRLSTRKKSVSPNGRVLRRMSVLQFEIIDPNAQPRDSVPYSIRTAAANQFNKLAHHSVRAGPRKQAKRYGNNF